MPLISDNYQSKKLKKYNINIKTKYIVNNNILERNTDNSVNDDIENGIRYEKEYYVNNIKKHIETDFDSRIEYTFIFKNMENKEYKCPNCGNVSKIENFVDGCPYCKTYYNIDYANKDLGSKYHYDRVLRSNKYKIITAVVDVIISMLLAFLFLKITSRTFNAVDISKVFIYGLILALILYYFFYIIDAYIVIVPIKRYKDKQNKKQQEFWKSSGLDKNAFFNNLNYEVRKYYYQKENIIDYDVLDYQEFNEIKKDDDIFIKVKALVRIVKYESGKIVSNTINDEYLMKYNKNILKLKEGVNILKCPKCSSSIDVNQSKCSYCGYEIDYLQQWILIKK